jgi:uncharacterized coiled-coil protein SlyX
LFEHQPDLITLTRYEVQSSVPVEIFGLFVKALETGGKVRVTRENAGSISLLAKEFWLDDLLSECSALQMNSAPELVAALSERISKLEHQLSSQPLAILAKLKESIANHERQLESLNCRISALEPNLTADLKELKLVSPAPVFAATPFPPVSPSKSLKEVEFPLKQAKSVNGIISYLTRKYGGNVHDKHIVTITSKSVTDSSHALGNVADLTSESSFISKSEPGQWICWDFHEVRVRPTHYTIKSADLTSWVVEASLDGESWTKVDRKTGSTDLKEKPFLGSFAVSTSAKCRFIRLTQTDTAHTGHHSLTIRSFEVFGTLFE